MVAFIVLTVLIISNTTRGTDIQARQLEIQQEQGRLIEKQTDIQRQQLALQMEQNRSIRLQAFFSERQIVKGEWDDLITAFMLINRAASKIETVRHSSAARLATLQNNPLFWEVGELHQAANLAERHIGKGVFADIDLFIGFYEVVRERVSEHGADAAYGKNNEVTGAVEGLIKQWNDVIDPAFRAALEVRGDRLMELHQVIGELLTTTPADERDARS